MLKPQLRCFVFRHQGHYDKTFKTFWKKHVHVHDEISKEVYAITNIHIRLEH